MLKKLSKALKHPKEDTKSHQSTSSLTGSVSNASLVPQEDASQHAAQLHPDAHEDGGLSCNNVELLRDQQQAIMDWIKTMGKRLFTGSFNLISTPMPVNMFEPRTYLEKLADAWVYPRYLHMACETSVPLERMKLVITWFVAGLHHGFEKWKKPFNPILGETWQADMCDGSTMYMEQISHHPPVSAFHLEGPGGKYRFRGLSQPNVVLMLKHYGFKTVAKGYRFVEFANGDRIDIHYPGYYIKGVVYSNKPRADVDGEAVFIDTKNQLKAVVRFGAVKGARAPIMRRSDAIVGEIYDIAGAPATMGAARVADEAADDASTSEDDVGAVPGSGSGAGGNDSEGFESASETDWDLRDLKEAAEAAEEAAAHKASQVPAPAPVRLPMPAHVSGAGRSSAQGTVPVPALASHASHDAPPSGAPSETGSATGYKRQPSSVNNTSSGSLFSGFTGISKMIGLSSATPQSSNGQVAVEMVGTVLSRVEGSWLSHLNIDGERMWTLVGEKPQAWVPATEGVLPSDSRFRNDLVLLREGDVKGSQQWKELLENVQRKDKKLRENGKSS